MFLTLVRIFPQADEKVAVHGFLAGILGPTRVQPGCLGCTLAQESDPDALLYMENWKSEDDLMRRLQSDEYAKVLSALELSTSRPELCIYEVIEKKELDFVDSVRKAQREVRAEPPEPA
jgi:quinol monooxygenase YgiN